ncbi:MAG TPA: hemolysin family protein, partial [Candidatus Saccharimonadales bacterium]|nr:hemolysin family protein [Candidatus Saccharimonadales bacterium]
MELIIILLLIILNGLFSMAEIAIVSTRRSKLQKQANDGDKNAQKALEIIKNPNRFFSTVQVGVTFIGIFTGAFGGETLAHGLSTTIGKIPFLEPFSFPIALFIVVACITYLSLIIGELVPKRIAIIRPDAVAKLIAGPIMTLSNLTSPLVTFLTRSSDIVLRVLQIKPSDEPTVSEEEVRMLIREGAMVGVFNNEEKDIVERTFQLDTKKLVTFMTTKKEIIWLDINSPFKKLRDVLIKHPYSHLPVCNGSLDKVLGIIRTEDLLKSFLRNEEIDLKKFLHKPIYVPETMQAWKVLELFKKSDVHMSLVVDEYGSVLGLLSLSDILEEIVGDIPDMNDAIEEEEIERRNDGTFVVDGLISIEEFKGNFHVNHLPGESSGTFHTVGGFI